MTFSFSSRSPVTRVCSFALGLLAAAQVSGAQDLLQSTWAGGPRPGEIEPTWSDTFEEASGIAWLAVPGQIVLGGAPLNSSRMTVLDDDFGGPASLYPADVDGDGDIDVLGAAVETGEIAWWRNDGDDTWPRQTINNEFAGAITIQGRDMDGDFDIDVLAGAHEHGEVAWWENTDGSGTAWIRHPIAENFETVHWVDSADVDGDGDIDALGASIDLNEIAVWINDADSDEPWSKQVIDEGFAGARVVTPGDLDGDGAPDLVGVALIDHEISWWRNAGGDPVEWQKHVIDDNFRGAHGVYLEDLDLDGDLDIIGAGFSAVSPVWWRNDGGDPISWAEMSLGGFFPGALNPTVGDVDGDNDLDVLVTSNTFHQVGWWRNDGGDPFEWSNTPAAENFTNAWPVITADLDSNGTIEVVSGASGSTEVAAWELSEFVPAGQLTSSIVEIPNGVPHILTEVEATIPVHARVEVLIRCAPDSTDLGMWNSTEPGWSNSFEIAGPAFCQYQVHLMSNDAGVSPVVNGIELKVVDGPVTPTPREGHGRGGL